MSIPPSVPSGARLRSERGIRLGIDLRRRPSHLRAADRAAGSLACTPLNLSEAAPAAHDRLAQAPNEPQSRVSPDRTAAAWPHR